MGKTHKSEIDQISDKFKGQLVEKQELNKIQER